MLWSRHHSPETAPVGGSTVRDSRQRGAPYATCRVVDDAPNGLVIIRVDHHSEIGYDVLYLLTLVETQSAIYAIRYSTPAHLLLQHAALHVSAVEYGKSLIPRRLRLAHRPYHVTHPYGLELVRTGRIELHRVAHVVLAVHVLVYLPLVVRYETVGRIDYILRAAVVLLELEHLGLGVQAAEPKYIVDVGTSERIYALSIVSHYAHTVVHRRKQRYDALLHVVGVLILIHEYVREASLIARAHVLMVFQQTVGIDEKVIEVHGIGRLAALLIQGIYAMEVGGIESLVGIA